MATGRRLIINNDENGWALFRFREGPNGERCMQSDRNKGVRKSLNKKVRTRLKREADKEIYNALQERSKL